MRVLLVFIFFLVVLSAAPVPSVRGDSQVTVFAAASMKSALDEVMERFRQERSIPVEASFAASSTLAKQIAHGAPADIYVSASTDWMDYLERDGLLAAGTRVDLLGNSLVLIGAPGIPAPESLAALPGLLEGQRLAMGDPHHVPAGGYAKAAFESLGLWKALGPRAAYAGDVRAALAMVARGEAPYGVVYATDARIADVRTLFVLPAESHPPIRYPVAVVEGRRSPETEAFYRFLCGDVAAGIFRKHGFELLPREERDAA